MLIFISIGLNIFLLCYSICTTEIIYYRIMKDFREKEKLAKEKIKKY